MPNFRRAVFVFKEVVYMQDTSGRTNMFIPIQKVDAEKREVWGYGAIEMPDASSEIMDYASSKPEFVAWSSNAQKRSGGKSFGNLRSMHMTRAAGKLIDFRPDDMNKGIFVGAKIVDEDEWRKVQEGVYTGFSVGGSYLRRWADPQTPGLIRYTAKPTELSLVDAPCIPGATFQMIKADGILNIPFQAPTGNKLDWVPDDEAPDINVPTPTPEKTQVIPGNLNYASSIQNMPLPNNIVPLTYITTPNTSGAGNVPNYTNVPSTEELTQATVHTKELDLKVERLEKAVADMGNLLENFIDYFPDEVACAVRKEVNGILTKAGEPKKKFVKVVRNPKRKDM
jgi:hypothetical protein